MLKQFFKSIWFLALVITAVSCANRGTPTGGEKDTEPPKIVKSVPENYSTNFNAKEIVIHFNEYVKIKNIQKQLIISPPMDPQPDIIPMSSASKYIKIHILDTLAPNTTYAFNFGQSIVDNNEGNPYPYYKYVFSTGDTIDSLSVKGQVVDAQLKKPDTFVSVMLYEVDSTYTDSVIYKQRPKYITNTLDSVTTFSLENLKAGKYLLVALKDANSNYTFQPKDDKIGYQENYITLPQDSTGFNLKLFKEELDFKTFRPSQSAGQKIMFGYQGDPKNTEITMVDSVPSNLKSWITKDAKTDTLYYWYTPKVKMDSTRFTVSNGDYKQTVKFRFRNLERDSLMIRALKGGSNFSQPFSVQSNIPLKKIEDKYISVIDKDSVPVDFTTHYDALANEFFVYFDKTESNNYRIQMRPKTFTDIFETVNDTLNFSVRTKAFSDYSNVRVTLMNATYPVIVQLTDNKGVVKYELASEKNQPFDFRNVETGTYFLRVVFDANNNQKWDTGNFLKKIQPERVAHYPKAIDARANWDPIVEFILE